MSGKIVILCSSSHLLEIFVGNNANDDLAEEPYDNWSLLMVIGLLLKDIEVLKQKYLHEYSPC